MKTKYILASLLAMLLSVSSCDKGFEKINTNPILPTSLDPLYMLVTAENVSTDYHMAYEPMLCQQMQILIGGNTQGGNRNTVTEGIMRTTFNFFYNKVKTLVDIIYRLKDNTDRTNLYNMARILKVYDFQILVDYYGDVPYSDAGLSYLKNIYLPKYDDQKSIYDDLVKELTEAVNGLDANKDKVTGEIYFAGDIPKWKKFGNSLLLRVGMRYTRIDEAKAKSIVATATDPARGGVMASNSDNAIVKFNAVQTSASVEAFNGSTKHNWHVGKPFVDFLQNNKDPRLQYTSVRYSDPTSTAGGTADTVMANQIGCPFGYDDVTIVNAPGYPGANGAAFKYSMFSRQTLGKVTAWLYVVTYAQTQLLLAEARQRGYITTGTVKDYYEAGIRGDMTKLDMFSTSAGGASPITVAQQNTYLARPGIVFDPANALKQINEQYWVASLMVWQEAWANFRRSGYPQLKPVGYPGEDFYVSIANGGDGFIHRFIYPFKEWSSNTVNVQEATTRIGGDNVGVRVFWEKK